MQDYIITEMIGKTIVRIEELYNAESLMFFAESGEIYRMHHDQDCCETVYLEDVIGDFKDLLHSPLTVAQSTSNSNDSANDDDPESYTWTFYNFATIRGSVHLRWYGSSNGYYSETASIGEITPEEYQRLLDLHRR